MSGKWEAGYEAGQDVIWGDGWERTLLLVKKTNRTQRKVLNKDTDW